MVEIAECYCDQTYGLMILEAINIVPGNGEWHALMISKLMVWQNEMIIQKWMGF